MSSPFIGQIMQVGFTFAPRGWATCSGQIMSISQNTALFSLLGTTYGGNGQTAFALPDLRGRVAIGTGQGPGTSNYVLGQQAGTENVQLIPGNLPPHSHTATFNGSGSSLSATTAKANSNAAASGNMLGRAVDGATTPAARPFIYAPSGSTPTVPLGGLNVAGSVTVGQTGGGVPFTVIQPYLAVTTIIALQGIFPSRN